MAKNVRNKIVPLFLSAWRRFLSCWFFRASCSFRPANWSASAWWLFGSVSIPSSWLTDTPSTFARQNQHIGIRERINRFPIWTQSGGQRVASQPALLDWVLLLFGNVWYFRGSLFHVLSCVVSHSIIIRSVLWRMQAMKINIGKKTVKTKKQTWQVG